MEKDLAPYDKIVLDKETKAEIRIYDGDLDPNILNRKRIGVYLFVNNEFVHSRWIECGKLIKNIIMGNPRMTISRKKELTDKATEEMRNKWLELNNPTE